MNSEFVHAVGAHLPDLLVIGMLLIAGWFADALGRTTRVPRVTLLLLVGVIAGPSFLNVIPPQAEAWFPEVMHIALAMVGFLLGESFLGRESRDTGRVAVVVSLAVTLGTALVVFAATYVFSEDVAIALVLAGVSAATDPAATLDVVREYRAKGPLTSAVLKVVAIDDAWGVILFSLLLIFAEIWSGNGSSNAAIDVLRGSWEVIGAILLGVAIGVPMAWMTGRVRKGEPTLLEAAGFVFICGGLALMLHVSYLLACMVLGVTVAQRAKHHTRPFREIEGASQPFLVMFFLLAGYECEVRSVETLGILGVCYVLSRVLGRVVAGRLSAQWVGAPHVVSQRIGWCLMPQAGVALGLALLANERLPAVGEAVIPLVIAGTVLFELIGPMMTWWHLKRAGELEAN